MPGKVLVIQPKMIGDVLASTVICQAVKSAEPATEVHFMITPSTRAVVDGNPFIDKIVLFDPPKGSGFFWLINFGKSLKSEKYDAVIDAYGKWQSIIPAWFSGAKTRIGFYKGYTSLFYTKTVRQKANVSGSAIYHRLQLAEALCGKTGSILSPKIYLSDSEIAAARKNIEENLDANVPIVMVSVLGSGQSKSLPSAQMAELLDVAAKENVQMIFNFIPDQTSQAKEIYNLCRAETQEKIVFDFYMKGLRAFLAVLSQCDALIGNEGGAVNMAKALGVPTFTVFSPWINKESWNMLSGDDHVAVHLNDFSPEIYKGSHPKKFKKQSRELYAKLQTQLYSEQLTAFLKRVIS